MFTPVRMGYVVVVSAVIVTADHVVQLILSTVVSSKEAAMILHGLNISGIGLQVYYYETLISKTFLKMSGVILCAGVYNIILSDPHHGSKRHS